MGRWRLFNLDDLLYDEEVEVPYVDCWEEGMLSATSMNTAAPNRMKQTPRLL